MITFNDKSIKWKLIGNVFGKNVYWVFNNVNFIKKYMSTDSLVSVYKLFNHVHFR